MYTVYLVLGQYPDASHEQYEDEGNLVITHAQTNQKWKQLRATFKFLKTTYLSPTFLLSTLEHFATFLLHRSTSAQ